MNWNSLPKIDDSSNEETSSPLSILALKSIPPIPAKDIYIMSQLTQSAAAIVMKPVIQQYLNSPNPSSLGEKVIMVLTSKVAQILWN
ncbi:2368_t:CDS:2 [Funneliformis geosporum]|uniref:2368_t:CDS:1 n=1 Tax=Funneliformis geosporum TaxID=1117311 RepID=A0A9W4SYY2_9GLOM|nr:2368_t:CDS:2 [Funneliformis geosporum]